MTILQAEFCTDHGNSDHAVQTEKVVNEGQSAKSNTAMFTICKATPKRSIGVRIAQLQDHNSLLLVGRGDTARTDRVAVGANGFHGLTATPGVTVSRFDGCDSLTVNREIQARTIFLICETLGDENHQLLLRIVSPVLADRLTGVSS